MPEHLSPHARPPQVVKNEFKRQQKAGLPAASHVDSETGTIGDSQYMIPDIPGLIIFPSLLLPTEQLQLLETIFFRNLSNPVHQTNVHMHYDIPYPDKDTSFFDHDALCTPKDPICHKPITTRQLLEKKLRWVTLGGQYDWTNKVYPPEPPPPFPQDIKHMIESRFSMKAEAAIVNLYTPGDTLSLHRDVSEMCDQPLVSISIGCECLFVVGLEVENQVHVKTLRLRSGDALLMSGPSRYAWHGVPKVLQDTCPDWLQSWPGDTHQQWAGWMKTKRINLNVRQMYETAPG